MTKERYFERMWEEEYYIFDSQTISEKEFDEKVQYEDYDAFRDSMMGDEVVNRLNKLNNENKEFKQKNEELKQQLQKMRDSFEFNCTQNYNEINKDKLYIKDVNTEICLNGTNLFIKVFVPQIDERYHFKYKVTGRSLMKGVIEHYDSKGRTWNDIKHR